MRILKTEVKGLHDDDEAAQPGQSSPAPQALPPAATPAPDTGSVTQPATPVAEQHETR
jgi:hypothetical protein